MRRQNREPATTPPPVYPRRRCDFCARFFPLTKDNKRFCSDAHRKAWHANRAGAPQLANRLPRMIADEVHRQLNIMLEDLVTRQELTPRGIELVRAAAERAIRRDAIRNPLPGE